MPCNCETSARLRTGPSFIQNDLLSGVLICHLFLFCLLPPARQTATRTFVVTPMNLDSGHANSGFSHYRVPALQTWFSESQVMNESTVGISVQFAINFGFDINLQRRTGCEISKCEDHTQPSQCCAKRKSLKRRDHLPGFYFNTKVHFYERVWHCVHTSRGRNQKISFCPMAVFIFRTKDAALCKEMTSKARRCSAVDNKASQNLDFSVSMCHVFTTERLRRFEAFLQHLNSPRVLFALRTAKLKQFTSTHFYNLPIKWLGDVDSYGAFCQWQVLRGFSKTAEVAFFSTAEVEQSKNFTWWGYSRMKQLSLLKSRVKNCVRKKLWGSVSAKVGHHHQDCDSQQALRTLIHSPNIVSSAWDAHAPFWPNINVHFLSQTTQTWLLSDRMRRIRCACLDPHP